MITYACAVPHPPLIIPSVGRGEEKKIQATINSYKHIASCIAAEHPETIIVSSPHAPGYRDGFYVSLGDYARGSFADFGASSTKLEVEYDQVLSSEIREVGSCYELPFTTQCLYDSELDHGTLIPLWFIVQAYKSAGQKLDFRVVRIGLSGLDFESHLKLGKSVSKAIENTGRKCVFVASGDWSHKLLNEGPYGLSLEGPVFDREVCKIFKQGNLHDFFTFDEAFCDNAAECGLRSFQIMTGALESYSCKSTLLSYEGPFGVGYGVAELIPTEKLLHDNNGNSLVENSTTIECEELISLKNINQTVYDPYCALAYEVVRTFICTGKKLKLHNNNKITLPLGTCITLPREMLIEQAGVFVSIHKNGDLRGCIGTISACHENIAKEIIENAILTCSQDPRFPAITSDEYPALEISVDVLMPTERIASLEELDVERYGVVVTSGYKRGLLLPNLEGVDTVEMQVDIACQKAGILPNEPIELERFEVIRHEDFNF